MNVINKVVFLRGKRVILRPLEEADAEACAIGLNDPSVRKFLGSGLSYMLTIGEERELLRNLPKQDDRLILGIQLVNGDGSLIGTVGMHHIDTISRTAVTGSMIYDQRFWNKGYGTEAKMLLLHHAFTELNLRKIKSRVLSFNGRSSAALKKQGYREEGRFEAEIYRNGRYVDEILYAVFKPEFMRLWNKKKKEILP